VLDRDFDMDGDAYESVLEIVRETVPCVVIDLPHVWTAWTKKVLLSADEIVITATPDLASLRNAKNIIDLTKQTRMNDSAPHIVINQVGVPKRPEIPVKDFAEAIGIEPTLVLPFNPGLFGTAANNGQMIAETEPKHAVAATFDQIAQIVTGRAEVKQKKASALAPLLAKLRGKKNGA